ncbi:MAG: UDP-3-O-[3-hydroxymyristoyl] N-acetylglucosamine deacetylase [Armatimonadetes bacterium]|nr:UDP-3-O-[3-hydroxymyristoyl] N-acetylglucosamine deacetylase [Armatimonadota bacterium]
MKNVCQRTLAAPLTMEGIGLHSGEPAAVALLPAEADTGLVIEAGGARFPARARFVSQTARCTCLRFGDIELQTVEHLLSALCGLNIDNCVIRWEKGREAPALDGSAAPIVRAVLEAGVADQAQSARIFAVREPLWIEEKGSQILLLPHEGLRLTCAVRFDHPLIGEQAIDLEVDMDSYARGIAPARTFGLASEVEALKAAGLALGGGPENALVIFEDGFSSPPRFVDECARHKALDILGDLSLCGCRLQGHMVALRPGHRINTAMARRLELIAGGCPR